MATTKDNIDVTIVIVAHSEGLLAYRTLRAWQQTRTYAQQHGIASKLIVVLNTATPETFRTVVSNQQELAIDQIITTSFSNPGPARNAGISTVTTPYTAIWDADDLPSDNWLERAISHIKQSPDKTVVHPELMINFGTKQFWYRHPNQTDDWCDIRQLIIHHYWSSGLVAKTQLFRDHPYISAEIGTGVGPEDWEWNTRVIAYGAVHQIAPGTIRFYRQKERNSLNNEHEYLGQLPSANEFFADPKRYAPVRTYPEWAYTVPPKKLQRLLRRFQSGKAELLPDWAISETLAMVDYEPELKMVARSNLWRWDLRAPSSWPGEKYLALLEQWPKQAGITHLFLLPWLSTGGADRMALKYIKTVASDRQNKVAVLITQTAKHLWRDRLPKGVLWIELDATTSGMPLPWQRIVLARLIMQRQPRVVHLINARIGWEVLRHHGLSVTQHSTWYATVFCDDLQPTGEIYGYARQYLGDTHQYLKQVFTDSESYRQSLIRLFGLPTELIVTHYTPAPSPHKDPSPTAERALLWAGRLDEQKRPDILAKIAARLPDVRFDVYGSSVITKNPPGLRLLQQRPNVRLRGAFTDFNQLPHEQYAGFIYTSQWDGLPNILLEATAAGLPIVAPNVGGVSELITKPTGYLVDRFDDVEQYVSAIRHLLSHRDYAIKKVEHAQKLISTRHSEEHWNEQLRAISGYLQPDDPSAS